MNDRAHHEWRTPARQRWTSRAAAVLASGLLGAVGSPILLGASFLLLDALGRAPDRVSGVFILLSWGTGALLLSLVLFWYTSRHAHHALLLTDDEVWLRAPLRLLRFPLSAETTITGGLRDARAPGGPSLDVEGITIQSRARGTNIIWLEPEDARVVVDVLTHRDPGAVRARLQTLSPVSEPGLAGKVCALGAHLGGSLFFNGLGVATGVALWEVLAGEPLAWVALVAAVLSTLLLLWIRFGTATSRFTRWLVLLDLALFLAGLVLGHELLS